MRLREALARERAAAAAFEELRSELMAANREYQECRDHVRELQRELEELRGRYEVGRVEVITMTDRARAAERRAVELEAIVAAGATQMQDDGATIGRLRDEVEGLRPQVIAARPSVRRFAAAMEERLRANDHKGAEGWMFETYAALLPRVRDELVELKAAIKELSETPEDTDATNKLERTVKEAADVANFAMFIADLAYKGDRA